MFITFVLCVLMVTCFSKDFNRNVTNIQLRLYFSIGVKFHLSIRAMIAIITKLANHPGFTRMQSCVSTILCKLYTDTFLLNLIHPYIPLTLYPRRGIKGISTFLRDAHVLRKLFNVILQT
jgi:hypothetical protein